MPSKEQLEAFEKYDFGADERWINYFNNITIPPERTDGQAIVRRYKQKFYQKHVDPTFEIQSIAEAARSGSGPSSSSTQSAPAPGTQSTSAPRSGSSQGAAPSGPARPPPAGSGQARATLTDWVTIQFLGNAWVIIMAAVAVFPFTPAHLAIRCFRMCLFGSVLTSMFVIINRYGYPRGFSWEAIKIWLQSCFAGPEVVAILHCGAFLPSPKPIVLAALPLACHLAPSVADYLQKNFNRAQLYRSYLEKPCTWLTTNRNQVNLFAANMEISLGFLVIFFLFTPQRNLLLIMFYWQILRLEYSLPATSWYHRQVWSQLGAKAEPLIQTYAPFLNTPLGYAKRWFTHLGS